MKTERVVLDVIDVSSRLRPLNEAAVLAMMDSMRRLGQLAPIAVYGAADAQVVLVAGAHRIEAAKRLGWNEIEAIFVGGTDVDRELQEIAENLHRAELTVLERSSQVARWIELVAAKEVSVNLTETSDPAAPKKKNKGGRPGKATAAAKVIGASESDVKRAVKVASISDDAKTAARDAGLDDNRTALLKVAKKSTPEKQVDRVAQIAADKAVKAAVKKRRAAKDEGCGAAEPKCGEFRRVDGQIKSACDFNIEDPGDVAEPGDSPEKIRRQIFLNRASEALRHARENGFDKVVASEITPEIIAASSKAAGAWAAVKIDLLRRAATNVVNSCPRSVRKHSSRAMRVARTMTPMSTRTTCRQALR